MKLLVTINAQSASDMFWRRLVADHQYAVWYEYGTRRLESREAENRRVDAEYDTGSVPPATTAALEALMDFLKPKRVVEVGTFIGKTTAVLARHAEHVVTCDMSNNIKLHMSNVTQFPKTKSTGMLRQLSDDCYDLAFIDGRVQPDDIPELDRVLKPGSCIVLDDCYQFEKGTVNAHVLCHGLRERQFLYLPPPTFEPFVALNIPGRTTLGVLVPADRVGVTQE